MAGASLPAHTAEEQAFSAGGQDFGGTLWLPAGAGWYPAVVVAGDSAQPAGGAAEFLRFLLPLGMAVLTFEAPDTGLAQTALAAADSLLMRADIRPELIGLLGLGAGAWAAARAAARAPETAFAVLLPGDSTLPGDLDHLAGLHCPVLAFTASDETAVALAARLTHNPDALLPRLPAGVRGYAPLFAGVADLLGPWLQQQAA
jgi:hypothetical protein